MRLTFWICTCLVALLAISDRACGQLMQLDYKVPKIVIESPEEAPVTFWERFEVAFVDNSTHIFTDRFHSINSLNWYLDASAEGFESFGNRATRMAARSVSRSVVTGVREAALDLPIMKWLDGQKGFVADLLLDSLDTMAEKSVNPLNPAYRILEKSWWSRISESRGFRYGIRPFQVSPYAFASSGIWSDGALLAMVHLRYHYRHFSDHQFELAMSVPLSRAVSFDVGVAHLLARHEKATRVALKLSKQLRGGGVMHVGMEVKDHPTFLVGMSVPL